MKYILLITITLLFFYRCSFTENAQVMNEVINEVAIKHNTKINGEIKSSFHSENGSESSFSGLSISVYSDSNYLGFYNTILYEIIDGLYKRGKRFNEYQVRHGNGDPILHLTNDSFKSLKECKAIADKAYRHIDNKEYQQLMKVLDKNHIQAQDTTIIRLLNNASIPKNLEYVGFVPMDALKGRDTIQLINYAYYNLNLNKTLTIVLDPESVLVAGIE